ncbi:cytochrome P450 [Solwaraspora sp. WMMD406]|uniref:cytochrome P450 n=1 Tax=Solwaraspora sp. WMMD406 TaxID=3016095 RepID=UPI002416D0F9|nr:cytochrome P450 [Solwaraspora sp. WMMD406]MDG4765803.1 cytochrome P450 [Solwaraspora sp. WMMD406]
MDLADPGLYARGRPEPVWAALRARGPVYRNRRPDGTVFWAVLSHRHTVEVLSSPETFVSERGMRLDGDPAAVRAAAGKMMIISDPPRHERIRRLVNTAFTPRVVGRLRDTIRRTAAEIVADEVKAGGGDIAAAAARLPASVVADLLGVPRADWPYLLERTMVAFGAADDADASQDRRPAKIAQAHTELFVYFTDLLAQRRADPADDVLSALAHGEIDGRPLTEEEIILNCNGLISGGNETTRHAVLGGLLALTDHPDQWRRLRADPGLLATGVPEVLRYTSPAMHVLRTAVRDVDLGGARIAEGDQVACWLPAANRDEMVFHEPDAFDVARRPNRHLAFGHGPHFCLGSALATAELNAFFAELLDQVHEVEPVAPARRMASNLIWGFSALPVRLTPKEAG